MDLTYVPILQLQRDLYSLPRDMARFDEYIRLIRGNADGDVELVPLVIANPMAKEHVSAALDVLLEMDADGIGERVAAEISTTLLPDTRGAFDAALVVADDLGGWTNRFTWEHDLRFGPDRMRSRKGEAIGKRVWVTGVLWAGVTYTPQTIRQTLLAAAYRVDHVQRSGPAVTLRDKLAQEGSVLAKAGCTEPVLDAEEIEYTREVIAPLLDATEMRTAVECLFGDEAARGMGFTPRGLSAWAGIALALHDARARTL
jgi:hypothetical protein